MKTHFFRRTSVLVGQRYIKYFYNMYFVENIFILQDLG
jgi:hypothetical protein